MGPTPRSGRSAAPSKRLTLKMVRAACLPSVFGTGRAYYDDGRVVDVSLDGETITGTILRYDEGYDGLIIKEVVAGTPLEDILERSGRERRAEISLRTGRRLCSCPYSRVGICSHQASLLICAVKEIGVAVPAGSMPGSGRQAAAARPDYRREAEGVLSDKPDDGAAEAGLGSIFELADACMMEGDRPEALRALLEVSEAMLSGLDYRAYSGSFATKPWMRRGWIPRSTREPDGRESMRVRVFCRAMEGALDVVSRSRMRHEQKRPAISFLHRMYVETIPWGPSMHYSMALASTNSTRQDNEHLRSLHDPVVRDRIDGRAVPDWSEDPVEFAAAMDMAHMQVITYVDLKDDSLLYSLARRYRDDPVTCTRYARYLRFICATDKAGRVEAEGRRLFPGADVWGHP